VLIVLYGTSCVLYVGVAVGEASLRVTNVLRCPRHGWMPVRAALPSLADFKSTPLPAPETLVSRLCALVVSPNKHATDIWALGVLVLEVVCGVMDDPPVAGIVEDAFAPPPTEEYLMHVVCVELHTLAVTV
jgi:hypothetical protein